MKPIDPTTLTADQLAPMLRPWASGLHATEAAVELLIAHDRWLRRGDFRAALIDVVVDTWTGDNTNDSDEPQPLASIDWDGVEDFLSRQDITGSSSEIAILRLAASLAGSLTIRSSLSEMTSNLDDLNGAYVLQALAHRYGWHERGRGVIVTGNFVAGGQ